MLAEHAAIALPDNSIATLYMPLHAVAYCVEWAKDNKSFTVVASLKTVADNTHYEPYTRAVSEFPGFDWIRLSSARNGKSKFGAPAPYWVQRWSIGQGKDAGRIILLSDSKDMTLTEYRMLTDRNASAGVSIAKAELEKLLKALS